MHPDERKILLYLEDQLSPGERNEIEIHLAQCPAFARQFVDLFRISQGVRGPQAALVDDPTWDRAVAIVRDRHDTFTFPSFFAAPYRAAIAAAAVLFLALTTYLFFRPGDEPTRFRSEETESLAPLRLSPADGEVITMKTPNFHWS